MEELNYELGCTYRLTEDFVTYSSYGHPLKGVKAGYTFKCVGLNNNIHALCEKTLGTVWITASQLRLREGEVVKVEEPPRESNRDEETYYKLDTRSMTSTPFIIQNHKEGELLNPCNEIFLGDEEMYSKVDDSAGMDSHYNTVYTLTKEDKKEGEIKVDPYFVYKLWEMSTMDSTGCMLHLLKNMARNKTSNSRKREVVGMYKTIVRMAQLEGIKLD